MVFKLNVTFHPQGSGFSHPTRLPARSILSSFQDSSSRHSLDRKSSQGGRARRTNPPVRPLSRPRFGGGELVAQLRSISLSVGKSSRLRKGTRLAGAQRRFDRRSPGQPDSLTLRSTASSRLRDVGAHYLSSGRNSVMSEGDSRSSRTKAGTQGKDVSLSGTPVLYS